MEARVELIDAAADAVAPIPAGWERRGGYLVGCLRGAHGSYATIVDTTGAPLLRVEVALVESVPAGLGPRVAEACLQANRDWLGARLYVTDRFGGALAAGGSLCVGPHASDIDPLVVRALVMRCITTAASIPPLVSAIERGASPYEAPSFASDNQILKFAGNSPLVPAADGELIEACLAAAEWVGWPARRADTAYGNGPNCAHFIVDSSSSPPAIATVDVRDGCLNASTVLLSPEERQRVPRARRSAVAGLLNGLANRTSTCGFALDFDEGFVRTDLALDTAGCIDPPSPELLCDFIFQAGISGAGFRDIVVSVAHQGVEPDAAISAFEANVGA
jgi:hypothetical protein